MKQLLTSLLLLITSITFSQKDLGLPTHSPNDVVYYAADIADDGSFVVRVRSVMHSYDAEGNKLSEKKVPLAMWKYDPTRKLWFDHVLHHGKFTVIQMDVQGDVTKSLIKDESIKGDKVDLILDESGSVNFYITSSTENLLPLVLVKYNPVDKTSKVINYRDIPGITGKATLIGERNNEVYFANYTYNKTKKNGFDVKIYAVNDSKELRLAETIPFKDSPELLNYVSLRTVSSANDTWGDDLYFSINAYTSESGSPKGDDKSTTQIVYKIDEKDQYAAVNLLLPYSASATHLPLKFVETEDNPFFFISDDSDTRVLYSADFSSSEVAVSAFMYLKIQNLMFYNETYPDLFEIGHEKDSGGFKICNGTARLVTITGTGEGTLHTREEVK